jgi:hypothetical protein
MEEMYLSCIVKETIEMYTEYICICNTYYSYEMHPNNEIMRTNRVSNNLLLNYVILFFKNLGQQFQSRTTDLRKTKLLSFEELCLLKKFL